MSYLAADILLIPELDEDGNDEDHRGLINSTLTFCLPNLTYHTTILYQY